MKEIFNEHLHAFNAFYKELSHIYHEEALAAGISDSAFEVLYCLSTLEDGCCQKHIAQASFLSKQTINSSIKALEKKGWIELRKGKGRECGVYLMDGGRDVIEMYVYPAIQRENEAFEQMGEENAGRFIELGQRYVHHLKQGKEKTA